MNSYLLFKSLHLISVISWMAGLLYLPRIFVYHVENSKKGKHIVLVPIAFVSEHSETLVELDIEYKEIADANGCKNYTRVPALGINEDFIKAMSELITKKNDNKFNENLYPPKIQCPSNFKKCPCLNYE